MLIYIYIYICVCVRVYIYIYIYIYIQRNIYVLSRERNSVEVLTYFPLIIVLKRMLLDVVDLYGLSRLRGKSNGSPNSCVAITDNRQ